MSELSAALQDESAPPSAAPSGDGAAKAGDLAVAFGTLVYLLFDAGHPPADAALVAACEAVRGPGCERSCACAWTTTASDAISAAASPSRVPVRCARMAER